MPPPEFRLPHPEDPDYVFLNAAFEALASPAARNILDLLRIQARTQKELSAYVNGHSVADWLARLTATGFVLEVVVDLTYGGTETVYRFEGDAMQRVATWVGEFKDRDT